jgi:hypothetical protein
LAGCGVASALLLGGLFGFHGTSTLAHAQSHMAVQTHQGSVIPLSATTPRTQMRIAPMSYQVAADYQDLARQDAINAGINPDYFVRQIQQRVALILTLARQPGLRVLRSLCLRQRRAWALILMILPRLSTLRRR